MLVSPALMVRLDPLVQRDRLVLRGLLGFLLMIL